MFEISKESIPAELMPIPRKEAEEFINATFPESKLNRLRLDIKSLLQFWHLINDQEKLTALNKLQDIFFDGLCPNAPINICQPDELMSLNGSYHEGKLSAFFLFRKWEIFFVHSYFQTQSPSIILGTWIHECFHGLLNFMSICLHRNLGLEFLRPPYYIMQLAGSIQINHQNTIANKLARKNLLGLIDRCDISIDSYNLNVEITVDTLSEILYLKLNCFQFGYERGYPEAEIYFKNRIQGYSSHKSIKSFS